MNDSLPMDYLPTLKNWCLSKPATVMALVQINFHAGAAAEGGARLTTAWQQD